MGKFLKVVAALVFCAASYPFFMASVMYYGDSPRFMSSETRNLVESPLSEETTISTELLGIPQQCRSLTEWEKTNKFDILYAWVNGTDVEFQESLGHWRSIYSYGVETETEAKMYPVEDPFVARNTTSSSVNRFFDKNELLFSLRSVEKYMNWVENIFIYTNGQVPSWLNADNPKIHVVTHEEMFESTEGLPIFNSNAIEANFHKIPFTTKKFLYFNDDMFLNNCVYPSDFTTEERGDKIRTWWAAPHCSKGCQPFMLVNGVCDEACNNPQCGYDNGECEGTYGPRPLHGLPETPQDVQCNYGRYSHMNPFRIGVTNSNTLLTKRFGPPRENDEEDRRVMSHHPYFFDVEAYQEVRREFAYYFDQNSKHKFRHPRDVAIQSLYSHYIHEKLMNEEELYLKSLMTHDENGDGILSNSEMGHYLGQYCPSCSTNQKFLDELNLLSENGDMSVESLVSYEPLQIQFRKHEDSKVGGIPKFKTEYMRYEGNYIMLHNSASQNRKKLDKLRKDRETQFFCINDGLTTTNPRKRRALERDIFELYMDLFP
eukprot:CAMPEP_0114988204 /NCGR_PEP_ID=MMETSP0216-20121206/9462_1 /TAXON_ID=223996 /ORGANISM="Protocruzia adherens, Strain Boccale" /LENGTH=543 /DNA_ID=CAMNT_0002350945 /DNA_START=107 /DNA_END=1734 /DNA_ORIENTATION=-